MKLLSFVKDDVVKVGLVTSRGILDLPRCYQNVYNDSEAPNWLYSMKHLLAGGEGRLQFSCKTRESGFGAIRPKPIYS
jgi:hypothetical protein